jgi:hypothetical protein
MDRESIEHPKADRLQLLPGRPMQRNRSEPFAIIFALDHWQIERRCDPRGVLRFSKGFFLKMSRSQRSSVRAHTRGV